MRSSKTSRAARIGFDAVGLRALAVKVLFCCVFCLGMVTSVTAATQPLQTDLRILDEMDDVAPWQALAADGTTASVHAAKGVQGGAMVNKPQLFMPH